MNEQMSRERFEEWHKPFKGYDSKTTALAAWDAQEAYWSKRVEEMEKAWNYLEEKGYDLRPDMNGGWDIDKHDDFTGKITPIIIQARTPLEAIQNAMKSNL